MQPIWMIRAKLCASGRNSRVDAPGSESTLASGPATNPDRRSSHSSDDTWLRG
jgi:hypothetical protein